MRISDWSSDVCSSDLDGFPPEHQFGFADGFPFLMTNQASLDELNRQLGDKSAEPITMNRFRPNIVVAGLEAYDEDYLTGMSPGELTFAVVKECARCPIPDRNSGGWGTRGAVRLI